MRGRERGREVSKTERPSLSSSLSIQPNHSHKSGQFSDIFRQSEFSSSDDLIDHPECARCD